MTERQATCPRCGSKLAGGSVLGELCPRCLLTLGMEPHADTRAADEPGVRFGAYQLIEIVGQGGMGVVWRAQQDSPIRRHVALKVVKPGGDSRQVLARFESERQSLAVLNHPNIAMVFDAGVTPDGRPYFVMEFVDGLPITTFADQHLLSIPARLELFLQVCDAIEHAHQKGLLHRDLKPGNILVSGQNGRSMVKIIDFGVAKALGPQLTGETLETQVGMLLGTPEYMSPEQAGLTESAVDTRSDVYSLGLVLYELLVGGLPFDVADLRRKAVLEMLRMLREAEPPRLTTRLTGQTREEVQEIARRRLTEPRGLLRQLRGDLEWITGRALEKEPARRYPSVSELRADVRRHLASEPVVAGPPGLRYRLGKLARRHRSSAIAASVALAALIVAAVVSTIQWIGAERARRDNRESLKTLHVATGLELASQGENLRALPWLVRALQLEEGDARAEELHRIRIRHLLDDSPYPIRVWHHEDLIGAYLARDGMLLATWDRGGTVRVWNPRAGEVIGPPLAHSAALVDVRLSGSTVVTSDAQGNIRVWDAQTGRESLAPLTHGRGLEFVRVSTAANRLLSTDRQGGIRLWALDSGRLIKTLQQQRGTSIAEFLEGTPTFALGDREGSLVVADNDTGEVAYSLPHSVPVIGVVDAGDERFVTATVDSVVRVWNRRTATVEFEVPRTLSSGTFHMRAALDNSVGFVCGDDGAAMVALDRLVRSLRLSGKTNCTSIDVSPDGLLVALGYADGGVRTWTTAGAEFTYNMAHSGGVVLARFLDESRHLLTVDNAGVVRVWDLSAAASASVTERYAWSSAFSSDGRRLALATGATAPPFIGTAVVVDAATNEAVLPPLRHDADVRGVAFSPDGRVIATGADNGTLRFWESATGEPIGQELTLGGQLVRLRFSPDGERLLTIGTLGQPASLWDVGNGRRIALLPETGSVSSASFSPDGRHVHTVASPPGRVQVWRASDGGPVTSVDWAPFDAAAFRSNDELVMVGADSIVVRALDGTVIATRPTGIRDSYDATFTRNGRTLVVPTATGTTHVFSMADSLAPSFPSWRLPGAISASQLSADGRWFIAASWQRQFRVWAVQTGEPVTPYRPLAALCLSASFSPAAREFQVSGSGVRRWDFLPDSRPAPVLEKLAQLWSAHELIGTDLVPLPVNRLLDLAQDGELARSISPPDDRKWRWMVARRQVAGRHWPDAEATLGLLAAGGHAVWDVLTLHGHALAELGRWKESVAAFGQALARRPDATDTIYYDALARANSGDAAAVDRACAAALEKFGHTRNPDRANALAALCVLAVKLDESSSARVRELARIAAELEPDIERFATVYAAALLRAGDAARAAALLGEVLERAAVRERSAETLLVYALAQHGAGNTRGAAAALARFDSSPLRARMPWHRRFEAARWQREF